MIVKQRTDKYARTIS